MLEGSSVTNSRQGSHKHHSDMVSSAQSQICLKLWFQTRFKTHKIPFVLSFGTLFGVSWIALLPCCFADQANHSVSNKSVVSSLSEWTAAESSPALPDDCLLGRAGVELLSAKWNNSGVSGLLRCSQVTNTGRWSQAPARGYCQRYHLSQDHLKYSITHVNCRGFSGLLLGVVSWPGLLTFNCHLAHHTTSGLIKSVDWEIMTPWWGAVLQDFMLVRAGVSRSDLHTEHTSCYAVGSEQQSSGLWTAPLRSGVCETTECQEGFSFIYSNHLIK